MTDEERILALETQADFMWNKVQELKLKDEFAAQIAYAKYRRLADELPPPLPIATESTGNS